MQTKREFLDEIEAFLTAHKMGAATFGMKAVKDPNFVFDLRRGRSPNMDLGDRVRTFMAEHADAELQDRTA